MGKPFLKKLGQKNSKKQTENRCQNAASEQKTTSERRKSGSKKKRGLE